MTDIVPSIYLAPLLGQPLTDRDREQKAATRAYLYDGATSKHTRRRGRSAPLPSPAKRSSSEGEGDAILTLVGRGGLPSTPSGGTT